MSHPSLHEEPAPIATGSVPVPDPTLLTTQNLRREVLGLRELLEEKLASLTIASGLNRTVLETRLDGMDKAIRLLQDAADKFPGRIDEKITSLRLIHDERFSSVGQQFEERDTRTEQAAGAVKVAVDAALSAQKEANAEQNKTAAASAAKQEAGTTKLIDQLQQLIAAQTKASDDKFTDVKERLTRIEGGSAGGRAMWGYVAAGLGTILTLVTLGGLFVAEKAGTTPPVAPQVLYVPVPVGTPLPVTPPAATGPR